MINMELQELFDGSLNDERMAEVLHALSVSPEKRTDFRRQMALQGAMQFDRLDNRLSNDEDAAIWGAITGLGAAAATAEGGYSMGWLVKSFLFVVMGVAGYLLGSNSESIFGGSSSGTRVGAPRITRNSLPKVIAIPIPIPATLTASASTVTAATRPATTVRTHTSASSLIAANDTRSRRNGNASDIAADTQSNNAKSSQPSNAQASSSQPNSPSADINNTSKSAPANVNIGDSSANLNGSRNGSIPQAPSTDTARKDAPSASASAKTPLAPEEVTKAMTDNQKETPESKPAALAFRTNGLEVAYGERMAILTEIPGGVDVESRFSSRFVEVSYRFQEGKFGLGGRLGYGGFSQLELVPTLHAKTDENRMINLLDTVYRTTYQTEQMPMVDLFLNYRLPISTRLGLGAETFFGLSTTHNRVGTDLFLLWAVSDRIGIQAGAGFSRYWFTTKPEDVAEKLRSLGDGASIDDNYIPESQRRDGGLFEGKFGIFFHL